ncbi:MAG: O-antigen ligase family protein, partial [Sulfuricaulis sp.]|nr:O-antigen ligase family protein [Sulfuricaulis sp.]
MRLLTLSSHAERTTRACAIALGFTIPISVALDNVLLALILALWIVSGGYRAKLALLSRHRVALAALSLFGLLVMGLAWGDHDTSAGLRMLGKYIDLVFVPIFVTLFQAERDRRRAWLALAVALLLTLALSYLTRAGLVPSSPFVMGGPGPGSPEIFKKALTQNILMAFGAFLFTHFAVRAQSLRSRILWAAAALLAVINVMVMVQGRTGQVILVVLTVYLVYSTWRRIGALPTALVFGIVVGALALGMVSNSNRLTITLEELKEWQPDRVTTTSTGQRLQFYRNSLEIIRDHPVIGVGTGGFAKAYASRVGGTDMMQTVNPHNEYLNIAVQLGIIGLVALLYLFYCQWRLAPALPTTFESHVARGL